MQKILIDPSSVSVLALVLVFRASTQCDQDTGIKTARTGKSCVKLVATVELFNPTVPECSVQIVNELDVKFERITLFLHKEHGGSSQ